MEKFSTYTPEPLSTFEKFILSKEDNLENLLKVQCCFFKTDYIYATYRDVAKGSLNLMKKLNHLSNMHLFPSIFSIDQSIEKLLERPVTKSNRYIKRQDGVIIAGFLSMLYHYLSKCHNFEEVDSDIDSRIIEKLKVWTIKGSEEENDNISDSSSGYESEPDTYLLSDSVREKVKSSNVEFDEVDFYRKHLVFEHEFFDCHGKLIDSARHFLVEAKCKKWNYIPHETDHSLIIDVVGNLQIEEFYKQVCEHSQNLANMIKYTQEDGQIEFDVSIGSILNNDTLTVPLFKDESSSKWWDSFQSDIADFGGANDIFGTIGAELLIDKRSVALTNAHVAFTGLSMNLPDAKKGDFNDGIKYAHYDSKIDVCLLPMQNNIQGGAGMIKPNRYTNSLSKWNPNQLDIGATVVKVGAKTGFTLGKFAGLQEEAVINNHIYENVVAVESFDESQLFTQHGDSGSIYFVMTIQGLAPIAIHRASDRDNGISYGCPLDNAIEKLRSKMGFENVSFVL